MTNKIKYHSSEEVIEEFYEAIANEDEKRLNRVHIPLSDVFYVRQKIFVDTGVWYDLDHVERAMYLEGHLPRKDVLDPDRKRDWE